MPGVDCKDLTVAGFGFSHASGAVVFKSLPENCFFKGLRVWSAAGLFTNSPLFLTWHLELTIFLFKKLQQRTFTTAG
jgi:hypothetical protein